MLPPFAQRLALLMNEKAVSQYTLGKAVGATRQTIAQYLDGNTKPSAEKLCAIADYFNVPADYLLGRVDYRSMNATVQSICEETGLSSEAVDILRDMKSGKAEKWQNPRPYSDDPVWFPDWSNRREGVFALLNLLLNRDELLEDLILLAQRIEEAAHAKAASFSAVPDSSVQNPNSLSPDEMNEYKQYMLTKQAQALGYRALNRFVSKTVSDSPAIDGMDFFSRLHAEGGDA